MRNMHHYLPGMNALKRIRLTIVGVLLAASSPASAEVTFEGISHQIRTFLMALNEAESTEFGTYQEAISLFNDGLPPKGSIDAFVGDADSVNATRIEATAFGIAFAGTESGGASAGTTLDFTVSGAAYLRLVGQLFHEWDPFFAGPAYPLSGRSSIRLTANDRSVFVSQTGDVISDSAVVSSVDVNELISLPSGSYRLEVAVVGGAGANMTVSGLADIVFEFFDLPGDFDRNGLVEQGDLDLVLNNWSVDPALSGMPTTWVADRPNANVDQEELDRVLNNWGSSSAPAFNGTTVPEPATLLLFLGLGCVSTRRRRVVEH